MKRYLSATLMGNNDTRNNLSFTNAFIYTMQVYLGPLQVTLYGFMPLVEPSKLPEFHILLGQDAHQLGPNKV